jgi:hypothetical protein
MLHVAYNLFIQNENFKVESSVCSRKLYRLLYYFLLLFVIP